MIDDNLTGKLAALLAEDVPMHVDLDAVMAAGRRRRRRRRATTATALGTLGLVGALVAVLTSVSHDHRSAPPANPPASPGVWTAATPDVPDYWMPTGIAATSASDVWVVASQLYKGASRWRPMVLHYDGHQWKPQDLGVTGQPGAGGVINTGALTGITALAPDDAWAVGSGEPNAAPFVVHWDGTAWRQVRGIPDLTGVRTRSLYAVTAVSHDDVWAVGGDELADKPGYSRPCAQHWDGTRWTTVPVPGPPAGETSTFDAVTAFGPNDVWAVGGDHDQHSFTEHWDGHTWTLVPSAPHKRLSGVAGLRPDDVWAVGEDRTHDFVGDLQHWDGHSWTDVPLADPHQVLYAIARDGTGGLLAVGTTWPADPKAPGAPPATPLVLRWRDGQWKSAVPPRLAAIGKLSAVAVGPDGVAWMATQVTSKDQQGPVGYVGHTQLPH